LGVSVACTGTSARGAFPTLANGVRADTICINNTGTDYIFVALGGSGVTATTACLGIPPGILFVNMPNAGSSDAPAYIAGITGGGSFTLQATLGNSVVG
jgi:hypothetical protein